MNGVEGITERRFGRRSTCPPTTRLAPSPPTPTFDATRGPRCVYGLLPLGILGLSLTDLAGRRLRRRLRRRTRPGGPSLRKPTSGRNAVPARAEHRDQDRRKRLPRHRRRAVRKRHRRRHVTPRLALTDAGDLLYSSGHVVYRLTDAARAGIGSACNPDYFHPGVDMSGLDLHSVDLHACDSDRRGPHRANLRARPDGCAARRNRPHRRRPRLGSARRARSASITAPPPAPTGWRLTVGSLVGPGANLIDTDLTGATLTGVDLTGAVLDGVHVCGLTGSPTQLRPTGCWPPAASSDPAPTSPAPT